MVNKMFKIVNRYIKYGRATKKYLFNADILGDRSIHWPQIRKMVGALYWLAFKADWHVWTHCKPPPPQPGAQAFFSRWGPILLLLLLFFGGSSNAFLKPQFVTKRNLQGGRPPVCQNLKKKHELILRLSFRTFPRLKLHSQALNC